MSARPGPPEHPKRVGTPGGWVMLAACLVAGVVILVGIYSASEEPGADSEGEGAKHEQVLADPPAPVLVRWQIAPGEELLYRVTSTVKEKLGQTTRIRVVSGTLALRARGAGEVEALLILGRETTPTPGAALPAGADTKGPGVEEEAVRKSFVLDARGRPVAEVSQAEELFRIFGADVTFPEEGLTRGVPALSRRESRPPGGGSGLLTRRQTWTRTVLRGGYACLRLEGLTRQQSVSPPRAGYQMVTESTSTSVCHFAYEQGFIVDLTVERADSFTSTGSAEAKVLAGTTRTYRQASLELLEVRPRESASEGPTALEGSPTPGGD